MDSPCCRQSGQWLPSPEWRVDLDWQTVSSTSSGVFIVRLGPDTLCLSQAELHILWLAGASWLSAEGLEPAGSLLLWVFDQMFLSSPVAATHKCPESKPADLFPLLVMLSTFAS